MDRGAWQVTVHRVSQIKLKHNLACTRELEVWILWLDSDACRPL